MWLILTTISSLDCSNFNDFHFHKKWRHSNMIIYLKLIRCFSLLAGADPELLKNECFDWENKSVGLKKLLANICGLTLQI